MSSITRRLISDSPLNNATQFNFQTIVNTLLDFIAEAPLTAPFNICINGTWGSGKTSLLKTLEKRINDTSELIRDKHSVHLLPIWFEPWKLADESDVLNALVNLILRYIENNASLLASGTIEVEKKDIVRLLAKRFLEVNPDEISNYYEWSSRQKGSFIEVESLFRKIASTYLKDKRRFIVFVDDLDRCPPKRVISALETIKLFFDMPSFIFIFALDREQIETAIVAAYDKFDHNSAKIYLEKIFQLTFRLPQKETSALATYVSTELESINLTLHSPKLVKAVIETFGRNLRNLKLFINAFNFQKQLLAGAIHSQTMIEDEVLFKWLYIETTIPQSLRFTLSRKSFGLVVALEFLAQGAMLYNLPRFNKYAQKLLSSDIQYLPLIFYVLVTIEESNEILNDDKLNLEQREIVKSLKSDGGIQQCLEILRVGTSYLVDQDLQKLAYISGQDSIEVENTSELVIAGLDTRLRLNRDTILGVAQWDRLGDIYKGKNLYRSAFCCYLMSLLMDFTSTTYWMDLADLFSRTGNTKAAVACVREAYLINPDLDTIYVQLAYTHDIYMNDVAMGSLYYRKALSIGSTLPSMSYNLAYNLWVQGDKKHAFYYALQAFLIDPRNESRRTRVESYAQSSGNEGLVFDEANTPKLEAVLRNAIDSGDHPLELSADEEIMLVETINNYPTMEDEQVREQFFSLLR